MYSFRRADIIHAPFRAAATAKVVNVEYLQKACDIRNILMSQHD